MMKLQDADLLRTRDAFDGKLIDVGCGTGLDAIRMAQCGHEVTATDWTSVGAPVRPSISAG
jgi:2-polyprenyl-3-methyl-5-hydroxy-6-metoxy-1,4-benzoquinol methylase